MLLNDIPPGIAALVGAITGGIIAELHYSMQNARERKKALRVLLFELLELRFKIVTNNPNKVIEEVLRFMSVRYCSDGFGEHQNETREMLLSLMKFSQENSFSVSFKVAIKGLIPHDPVLAYQLYDIEEISNHDKRMHEYFESIKVKFSSKMAETDLKLVENMKDATIDWGRDLATARLSEIILEIARKISCRLWFKSRRIITRQDKMSIDDDVMGQYFEKIFGSLKTSE
ncbi:MAG: hypothetical protein WC326_12430 [Candidatus Delongbacteria bacterium]